MLPAGIIAYMQTNALEREISARSEASLLGATLQAAARETSTMSRMRGMTASLAMTIPFVVGDQTACDAVMDKAAAVEPIASVVAFVPLNGLMTCASRGREHDFSDDPLFQQVRDAEAPYFWVNSAAPVSGTSVLGISEPVYDQAGDYIGYAVMAVPHAALQELRLESLLERSKLDDTVVFWTFDENGSVLTSSLALKETSAKLPAGRTLKDLVGTDGTTFRGLSKNGQNVVYAVVPIVKNDLYLMSSFLSEDPMTVGTWGMSVYLPTALMWLGGLIVAGFAAEFLVTRHVRALNRSIVSFAHGDRRLQTIDMRNAPTELHELADAYLAMTESITRSEAELEDSVHQKEVLLREVHHRVKNNLQLISSIMNIQIRSAVSGEAKDLLKNLQERIMSLATVHRGLYQTSGLADVRARELIPDIVRQIMAISSGPEKPFETVIEIDDLRLVPDQAVPLSLLLTEALANSIKHSGARRSLPGTLSVKLKRSGGSDAVLEVVNSVRETDSAATSFGGPERPGSMTGIGSQLITAFVQQLGGRQETDQSEDGYFLRVVFNVSPLSLGENRLRPELQDGDGWNTSNP